MKKSGFIGYSNDKFNVLKKRKVNSFYKASSKESTTLSNNSFESPFLDNNFLSIYALYEDLSAKMEEIDAKSKPRF